MTAILDGVIYIIGNIIEMNVNHVSGLAASSATPVSYTHLCGLGSIFRGGEFE